MKGTKLKADFFNRDTLVVAKELLGKYLVRKVAMPDGRQGNKVFAGKIIETEAYCGPHDLASHASKGRTKRTEVMFGPAGVAYIYLIYGMYYCLNIVTEKENYPSAILIRALDIEGAEGPGKLCRILKINKTLNMEDITNSSKLWIENRGEIILPRQITRVPRIGVDYAEEYKDKPWRFVLMNK